MKMVFKWSVTFGNSYHSRMFINWYHFNQFQYLSICKRIKRKNSKREKWKVVAGNLIELFSDPLHGAPFYFLTGVSFW